MTIEELRQRADDIQDKINAVDVDIAKINPIWREAYKQKTEIQDEFDKLQVFVLNNNPDGIDINTPSSSINQATNKKLFQLKEKVERLENTYNLSNDYRNQSQTAIENIKNDPTNIQSEQFLLENRNCFAINQNKWDNRYLLRTKVKKSFLISAPAAVIAFLLTLPLTGGVGSLVLAAAIICGTIGIRDGKSIIEAFQTRNSLSKKNIKKVQARVENAKQQQEAIKNQLERRKTVDKRVEKDYQDAKTEFNNYLENCKNKKSTLSTVKRSLDKANEKEQEIYNQKEKLETRKNFLNDSLKRTQDQIDKLENGGVGNNNNNNSNQNNGGMRRS